MQARFIGDPNDGFSGPDEIQVFGVDFVKGKWREVSDERFANHSHFETKATMTLAPKPAPLAAPAPQPAVTTQ